MARAKWFFLFGTELVRRCHEIADGRVFDENILLQAHGALVLGILRSHESENTKQAENAWRVLRDAESFLGGFPVPDGGVTSAIVNLRAAELCLLKVSKDKQFAATRRALRELDHFQNLETHLKLRKYPEGIQEELRDVIDNGAVRWLSTAACQNLGVKVAEAINWLDRAETVLIRHPKSRWWWSIFAVLKTKACEYLQCLRLARSIEARQGQGMQPRILLPSAFIFLDSGLLRLVGEKDFEDIFFLSRVLGSLVEIFRCESYYAILYPSKPIPNVMTVDRQQRRSKPLLQSRLRLIRRLTQKLQVVYDDLKKQSVPISAEVLGYAERCLKKANVVCGIDCG